MVDDSALSPLAQRRRRLHQLRQEKLCRTGNDSEHRHNNNLEVPTAMKSDFSEAENSLPLSPTRTFMKQDQRMQLASPEAEKSFDGYRSSQVLTYTARPNLSVSDRAKIFNNQWSSKDSKNNRTESKAASQEKENDAVYESREEENTNRSSHEANNGREKQVISPIYHMPTEISRPQRENNEQGLGFLHSNLQSQSIIISVPETVEHDAASVLTASSESENASPSGQDVAQGRHLFNTLKLSDTNVPTPSPFLKDPSPSLPRNSNNVNYQYAPEGALHKTCIVSKSSETDKGRVQNVHNANKKEDGDEDDLIFARSVSEFAKYFDKGGAAFVPPPEPKGPSKFVADRAKVFDSVTGVQNPNQIKQQGKCPTWAESLARRKISPTSEQQDAVSGQEGILKAKHTTRTGKEHPHVMSSVSYRFPIKDKCDRPKDIAPPPSHILPAATFCNPSSRRISEPGTRADISANQNIRTTTSLNAGKISPRSSSLPTPVALATADTAEDTSQQSVEVENLKKQVKQLKLELQNAEQKSKRDAKRSMTVFASALKEIDMLRSQTENLKKEVKYLKEKSNEIEGSDECKNDEYGWPPSKTVSAGSAIESKVYPLRFKSGTVLDTGASLMPGGTGRE